MRRGPAMNDDADLQPTPSRNYPPDDQHVSDAHRDHAVSELSEAFQTGRITADEFEQRSGRALSARTGKDLTDLFTDLQKDNVPAARTAAGRLARSPRVAGTWIAMGVSGAAATSLVFLTLVNALTAGTNPGLTLPEPSGRPPHLRRVGGRIGRRQLHQPPGRARQGLQLPVKAVLDPPVQQLRAGQPEPACQLSRRQPARQLQQGQRVPVRVGDDLLLDQRVQRPGQHRVQQLARVTVGQAFDQQLGQPGQVIPGHPGREHHADRVGGPRRPRAALSRPAAPLGW